MLVRIRVAARRSPGLAGMHRCNMLGLAWFDKKQNDGIYHQDWRIEDNFAAQAAFQLGISALTLAHP
jgi:hypothetical protein